MAAPRPVEFVIRARDRTRRVFRRVGRALRNLGRDALLTGRRIGLIAVAGFTALSAAAVRTSSRLVDVAGQLGKTTTFLQAFQNAAKTGGVNLEAVNEFLQRFNTNLGKAQEGNAAFVKAFAAAGITGSDLLLPVNDVLDLMLQNVKDLGQAGRQAIVNPIGDVSGVRVVNALLSQGLDTIEKIQAAGGKFGIIPEGTLKRLDDAGDKFFTAFQNIKPALFTAVANALDLITPKLPGLTDALVGFIGAVDRYIQGAVSPIKRFFRAVQSFGGESRVLPGGVNREAELRRLRNRVQNVNLDQVDLMNQQLQELRKIKTATEGGARYGQ